MHFRKKAIVVAVLGACAPLAASAAPSISWKTPGSGASLYGVYSNSALCEAAASGANRVKFYVDAQEVNTDNSAPYQCSFDTRRFHTGSHTLKATAIASDGSVRSVTRSVTFASSSSGTSTPTPPPPTSNVAPSVSLTSPGNGQTVSGTVTLAAIAADDRGVSRVVFSVGSSTLATDTSSPYSASLNTSTLSNGTHTVKAQAFDAEGLSSTSQVAINVQNGTTTTPPPTGTVSTPAPGSGSLDVWFKAPLNGKTVSGVLSGTNCYVNGTGVAKVDFKLDGAMVNSDTTMSNGMQCVLDTTRYPNGTHQFLATATSSTGATRGDLISINIQNATSGGSTGGSTTPPPPTGGDTGGSTTPPPTSSSPMPTDSSGVRGVPTFQSIGMYWTNPGAGSAGCKMQFRKKGDSAWRDAMDMWFDSRNSECRGSIVMLQPGTQYEVQMGLPGQAFKKGATVATWKEQFPIAQTITLPASSSSTLNITSGGTPNGYILYTAGSGGSTIDVKNAQNNNIVISAPYVIVRGLTLKGAKVDAIALKNGAHDVVIEGNDISGWGRYNVTSATASNGTPGWQIGVDMDSGVRGFCSGTTGMDRFIIQRNKIHDPRYGANSWDWGHPAGPQGITFSYCGVNHVIRYNEIYSTSDHRHYYNDGIGGEDNFSATGFPNADSDIYGNRISQVWDEAIEAEGGNKNVRIFGNYTDNTNTGVGSTVTHWGPLYVFRNVHNRSRAWFTRPLDSDDRNNAYKSGQAGGFGGGRRFILHNTLLQASQSGVSNGLGMGGGIAGNTNQPLTNTVSRNNIFHVWKPNAYSIYNAGGSGNDVDYDLRNGSVSISGETHGFVGTPVYASGNGWQNESGGNYRLGSASLGYGKAARLPNFNDAYSAPDIGAHQSSAGPMSFGVNGNASFWVSGTPTGGGTSAGTSGGSTTTSTSTTTLSGPGLTP
jgi:hypothetical protein